MMYNAKIDRLLDGWREEMVGMLSRWLSVASVSDGEPAEGAPFGLEVRRMLDTALADARALGFETYDCDGYAGHAQLGAGERTMGILAHLDVVPAGDGWKYPPFAGTLEGGKLYGRGTSDDKGPALAALFAMRAVREAGVPLKDGVRLIMGCDEEAGMRDMRHYAAKCRMPDYGFTPDAEYPVINTEKGHLHVRLVSLDGGEEGAEIPVLELYAGERRNVVPGSAYAVVGCDLVSVETLKERLGCCFAVEPIEGNRARITAKGVSAHASTPHLGVNAASVLMRALASMGAGGGSKAAIAALADKIGLEGDGSSLGIAITDEISGSLTCNLGILRYDGHKLTADLDIRYPLAAREADVCGHICAALSGSFAVARMGGSCVYHVPEDSELVKGLLEVYGDITGLPSYAIAIGGGTYARMMPSAVAFGIGFPGDVECAHMPDECVDVDKLMLSARVMAHAIEKLAGA